MTTTAFDKALGTTEWDLSDRLMKVHDAVPNAEKRRSALLMKATDATMDDRSPDLEMLAGAMLDAARGRLDEMVSAVQGAEALLTRDQARAGRVLSPSASMQSSSRESTTPKGLASLW